jgi:ring-1,2-phenylacetyl-CoA epoxidase subunit PaaE
MPKKSLQDNHPSVPGFTQGINALLKCFTSLIPRMEWLSNLVRGQVETTLSNNMFSDPLSNLPPLVRETLLQLPQIAWPTIVLFGANLLFMLCIVGLREFGWISYVATCVVLTCCMFVMFTVAHDAAHGSISKDFKLLNEIIGRLSFGCIGPLGCFAAWKWIHHMHHKFTNHPEKDPDRFCSHGGILSAPFRCLLVEFSQLYFYISYSMERPIMEVLEMITHVSVNLLIFLKCFELGHGAEIVFYWILPSFMALSLLAFFFDFIPHYDHEATPIQSRFHTTSVLKTYPVLQPLLTLLLQYQDYHLIHHLYPTIPFYRYADKWHEKQQYLLNKNVTIKNFTLH